ncbi:MAG: C45 family peptidase [Solirubrobacterales bacterium]
MIRTFRSAPADPGTRGREFGRLHAERIAATAGRYVELFGLSGGRRETERLGEAALARTAAWFPAAAEEIEGIAAGSGLSAGMIGALNARTEILAVGGRAERGECSTLLAPGGFAAQTWDWYEDLRESWLVWSVELPGGGSFHTLTEYGVLGKIGINPGGVAVLLNILHHDDDGAGDVGVPVHVVARRVLEEARSPGDAAALAGAAPVSASSSLTLVGREAGEPAARCVELWPGGPGTVPLDGDGFTRTNHFLSPAAVAGDREPVVGPDSFHRHEVLGRRLGERRPDSVGDCFETLCSHEGGASAICVHPDGGAPPRERYATLATVAIDVGAGAMTVRAGGPCEASDEVTVPAAGG